MAREFAKALAEYGIQIMSGWQEWTHQGIREHDEWIYVEFLEGELIRFIQREF